MQEVKPPIKKSEECNHEEAHVVSVPYWRREDSCNEIPIYGKTAFAVNPDFKENHFSTVF